MFDIFYVMPPHARHIKDVRMKEIKAPTDESVRLLNEMQQKAFANLISSVKLEDNLLKATMHRFYDPMNPFDHTVAVQFSLNNKPFKLQFTCNYTLSQEEFLVECRDRIAKVIGNEILLSNVKSLTL